MNESNWKKVGAATGIVFVALLVATLFTAPSPKIVLPIDRGPFVTNTTEGIVSYFSDNQDGVLLTAFLVVVAGAAFLWFAGTLLSYLRTAEGGTGRVSVIGFSGAIASAALFTAAGATQAATALSIEESTSEIVRAMVSIGYMLSGFAEVIFLVWVVAVVLVIFRTRALPAWLGWLGALNALLGAYGVFDIFSEGVRESFGPIFSIEGALGIVSFLVFLGWLLLLAITLTMRIGTREEQAPA